MLTFKLHQIHSRGAPNLRDYMRNSSRRAARLGLWIALLGGVVGLTSPAVAQFLSDGGSSSGPSGSAAFAPTTEMVENAGIGTRVMFLGRSADDPRLTASVEIKNLKDEPIYIALIGPAPAAVDTLGVTYQLTAISGLAFCKNLQNDYIDSCLTNYSRYLPGSVFSVLQPGASSIVLLTYGAQKISDSGFLSMSMNIALATGVRPGDDRNSRKLENVNISFPLIELGAS